MALKDPMAIYTAANNMEAHLVSQFLMDAGIEAHVSEDVSQVGVWMLGLLPEIHKPRIWIERADAERAVPVLTEFERLASERRQADAANLDDGGPDIEVVCDACGEITLFPAVQRGSVQSCPRCGAYLDVGDLDDEVEEAFEAEGEAREEE